MDRVCIALLYPNLSCKIATVDGHFVVGDKGGALMSSIDNADVEPGLPIRGDKGESFLYPSH